MGVAPKQLQCASVVATQGQGFRQPDPETPLREMPDRKRKCTTVPAGWNYERGRSYRVASRSRHPSTQ